MLQCAQTEEEALHWALHISRVSWGKHQLKPLCANVWAKHLTGVGAAAAVSLSQGPRSSGLLSGAAGWTGLPEVLYHGGVTPLCRLSFFFFKTTWFHWQTSSIKRYELNEIAECGSQNSKCPVVPELLVCHDWSRHTRAAASKATPLHVQVLQRGHNEKFTFSPTSSCPLLRQTNAGVNISSMRYCVKFRNSPPFLRTLHTDQHMTVQNRFSLSSHWAADLPGQCPQN